MNRLAGTTEIKIIYDDESEVNALLSSKEGWEIKEIDTHHWDNTHSQHRTKIIMIKKECALIGGSTGL